MGKDLVELITSLAHEILEAEGRGDVALEPDTELFGRGGLLDSMGIVSLVVATEQAIEDRYGVSVALADEQALSQRSSPYQTIRTLADYALSVVESAG